MNKWKPILDSILCMTKCSFWATLMNLSIIIIIMIPFILLYNLLCYVIIGTPVHYLLRKQSWEFQAILVWLTVNVISLAVMFHFLLTPPEPEGQGPMCFSPLSVILPITSALAGLLSIIPIGILCRKARKKTDE